MKNKGVTELLGLIAQYPNISKTHFHYAEYIDLLEQLFQRVQTGLCPDLSAQLKMLIFDMEVINGLALCDWEQAKRPQIWDAWKSEYQVEVQNLIQQLKFLLLGKQQVS